MIAQYELMFQTPFYVYPQAPHFRDGILHQPVDDGVARKGISS